MVPQISDVKKISELYSLYTVSQVYLMVIINNNVKDIINCQRSFQNYRHINLVLEFPQIKS